MDIKDKKDCENDVVDHLSRLLNDEVTKHEAEVLDEFLDERVLAIQERSGL